VVLYGIWTW